MTSSEDTCCTPGDIIVTQVQRGWMLARALAQIGPGPWWSFIAIVRDHATALYQARVIARHEEVRAWLQERLDQFTPIPLDDSSAVAVTATRHVRREA